MTKFAKFTKLTKAMRTPEEMQALVRRIVGLCMKVHRYFGPGQDEIVYENSVAIEFRQAEIPAVFQPKISVYYYADKVGGCKLDCLVDDELVVEFKAEDSIKPAHEAQVVRYLNATKKDVALLINFGGPSLQFRTKSREYKGRSPEDRPSLS